MCRMQSLETNRLSTAPMSIVYSFLDEASSMITVCKQTVPMIDPLLLFFFSHWRFICVFYVFFIITVFNRVKLHFSAVFTVINFISMATTTKRKSNFGRIITENKPILMMMESVKFFLLQRIESKRIFATAIHLFIDYFYLLFLSSFNDIESLLLFKSSSNWSTGSSVFWTIFSLQLNFNDRFINNNNKTHRNYSKLEFSFSFFVSNSFSVVECFELNLILFWDRINKWPFFFHKITIHRFHLLDKLFVTLVDFFLFIKWPNKKCLRISRGSTPIKIG